MRLVQLRCRSGGPYRVGVGGVLGVDGVRRGPHALSVSADGSWTVGAGATAPVEVSLPDLVVAPALADAHVHLHPDLSTADYLAYGVARIRELGSRWEYAPAGPHDRDDPHPDRSHPRPDCADPLPDCAHPLPELVRTGPMLDRPGPPRLLIAAQWDTPEELPGLLDDAAARGASWVKFYEGFPAELFRSTVALAHDRGLRVAVHPAPGKYAAALDAGVDELEHLACLLPSGPKGTHALLARWAGRAPGERWPRVPPGTLVCPTLLAQHTLVAEARAGWVFEGHDPTMAAFWRSSAIARRAWTGEELANGERAVAALADAFAELDAGGVRWVVGSDTPNPGLRAGQSLWRELNLLVEAGMDRLRAYRAAAVAPGVDDDGDHALTFLPAAALRSGPFPDTPPAATLLRGCLYGPEEPDAELST